MSQVGLAMRLRQVAPTLYICAYIPFANFHIFADYADYADMRTDAHREKVARGQFKSQAITPFIFFNYLNVFSLGVIGVIREQ